MLSVLLFDADARSEELPPARREQGLQGMPSEQVVDRYGPPDRKTEPGPGRETWYYGRSMMLLEGGKVKAYSDAGDLQSRLNLGNIKNDSKDEDDSKTLSTWSNAWTPREPVSKQEIVEDLMK